MENIRFFRLPINQFYVINMKDEALEKSEHACSVPRKRNSRVFNIKQGYDLCLYTSLANGSDELIGFDIFLP